jgi:hypothetical protein
MADGIQYNNAFFDQLGRSPGVIGLVDEATERIADTARSTAPVGETGEYRDGIGTAGKFQRRYVGLVIGNDDKTMLIEAKTANLARALRANRQARRG